MSNVLECKTSCVICNIPCMLSNIVKKTCPVCQQKNITRADGILFCHHCCLIYSLSHPHSHIDSYVSIPTEYEYDGEPKIGIPVLESLETLISLMNHKRFKITKLTCFCHGVLPCEFSPKIQSSCPNLV